MRRLPAFLLSLASIGPLVPAPAVAAAETSRTVYVTVVDNEGRPVTGLTPADFVLKESGKERAIVSVEPAKEKARLALMIEVTMTPFIGVRQGLADFVVRMCPTAEIALIVVANRAETVVDYTSDVDALIAGIKNLSLSRQQRSTMVPEGVAEVARALERSRPARPVIVLLAFEMPSESSDLPHNILNQIARSRATFSVVATEAGPAAAAGVGTLADSAVRAQVMGEGPKQSGGRTIEVSALTAFPARLQQIADDLLGQCLITYTLPDGVKPSDRLAVTLKRKGAILRSPTRVSDQQ